MCLEVLSVTEPKAKKKHCCIWCGEPILMGEKHHRQVGKFDGRIQDGRFHRECWTASDGYFVDGVCEFEERGFKRGTALKR